MGGWAGVGGGATQRPEGCPPMEACRKCLSSSGWFGRGHNMATSSGVGRLEMGLVCPEEAGEAWGRLWKAHGLRLVDLVG